MLVTLLSLVLFPVKRGKRGFKYTCEVGWSGGGYEYILIAIYIV